MIDPEALAALSGQELAEHFGQLSKTSGFLDAMEMPRLAMRLELASDAASLTSEGLARRLFATSALLRRHLPLARSEFAGLVGAEPAKAQSCDVLGLVRAEIGLGAFAAAEACLAAHSPGQGWEDAFDIERIKLAVLQRDYAGAQRLADGAPHRDGAPPALNWLRCYLDALVRDGPRTSRRNKLHARVLGARFEGVGQAAETRCLIGLYDYKSPEMRAASMNIGDTMQTLAMLRHVVRHFGQGALTADDPDLPEVFAGLAKTWQGDSEAEQMRSAPPAAHIALLDRDFPEQVARLHPKAEIILIMHGWFLHKVFGHVRAFDLPSNVRPFVLSFYLQRADDLTEKALAFLKAHQPIGCRDWSTVYLLLNQGIEAFFSGCVTTTLGATGGAEKAGPDLYVDVEAPGGGAAETLQQNIPRYRTLRFAEGIKACLGLLDQYQGARRVITSRLHCALPATAVGAEVTFQAKDAADRRFEGLIGLEGGIDPAEFADIRRRTKALIDLVYGGHAAGKDHAALRAEWAEATGPFVAEARARLAKTAPLMQVTAPQAVPPQARGEVVNLAIAFDPKIQPHVRPMLRSILANTTSPLRVFALTRGVSVQSFADMQADFPALDMTQLPMDARLTETDVHLQDQITLSTMDRLFLPDLLPDVDRLVYLDIDVTVCADIAALAQTPLTPKGIGARATPNPGLFQLHHWIEREVRLKRLSPADARRVRRAVAAHGNLLGAYVNAGVLVMSLDALRQQGFTQAAVDLVTRYGFDDQLVLNLFLQGDFAEIGAAWNLQPYLESTDGAKLVHWAGARKPWQRHRAIRSANLWARHADPPGAPDWTRAESYPKGWAARAETCAPWFPQTGRIADIGCGPHLALAAFMPPQAEYAPFDQRAWTEEVGALDLEIDPFPQGPFAAVAMLGVLEYLTRPGAVLRQARKQSEMLITSYVHPVGPDAQAHRAQMGWINRFSEARFADILERHGWEIAETKLYSEAPHSRQILYKATPISPRDRS